MLGFFDSGLGGLTVLKEAVKLLPQYSYLYLGDNARAPYGDLDQETIYDYTVEGASELFRRGSQLVVLACNTSSSAALRRIQQEFLPEKFPEKHILGIIVPTAEEIGSFTESREVGILGTQATVNSLAYTKEIAKAFPEIKTYEAACPMLVPLIEEGNGDSLEITDLIQIYLNELLVQSFEIDTVILGCTHFALIEDQIKRQLPYGVRAISQGPIIAEKLKDYLSRHPGLENDLEKNSKRVFLSTDDSPRVESLSSLFYGSPVKIELVKL
ncbi:MAG: glutamate racemase [Candidatus Sungbacteria bacterium]|uniref:Glutamate racemase n=1 Tax=Candidatus Sungiibacteriota bacterium TaxID=2750080 RepID=A0A931SBH4_9BACT|nr:glutamate racemase [Candidatus Sungbacteria bacterium]